MACIVVVDVAVVVVVNTGFVIDLLEAVEGCSVSATSCLPVNTEKAPVLSSVFMKRQVMLCIASLTCLFILAFIWTTGLNWKSEVYLGRRPSSATGA